MKKLALFLMGSIALIGCLKAQAPASPLPLDPLIQKRAPDLSQWTISLSVMTIDQVSAVQGTQADDAKSGPNKLIKKTTVTKTGNIIHTVIIDGQNQSWNLWSDGKVNIVVWPDGQNIGFAAPPPNKDMINPYYIDYSSADFFGFDWINKSNYVDIKSFQGRPCLVFQEQMTEPAEPTESGEVPPPNTFTIIAYIDLKTRLPAALQNEDGLQVYQFQNQSVAMQKVPDNVQAFIDNTEKHIQALANRPVTPF